jgi:NTE family protein
METRAPHALVIGGGGLIGGAWELGVLSGLREHGFEHADLVLGTSIGAVVGAAACAGTSDESVLRAAAELGPAVSTYLSRVDPTLMTQIMGRGFGLAAEERATIGGLAAQADSGPETEFIDSVSTLLLSDGWPPGLAVTGVAIDNGEFVTWDERSGVPLQRAVAASCAGPGLFPPVNVDGRRYIDGGIRSPTNADRASGHERVVIITAIGDEDFQPLLNAEAASLRRAGARVLVVTPDERSIAEIGPDTFDVTRLDAVWRAGRRQVRSASAVSFD